MEDLNEQHINEEIPVLDTFSAEFRKLISVSTSRHRYLINIDIVFPLFSKAEFLLFRAYPIMKPQEDYTESFIIPDTPYIALKDDNSRHCLLSEYEITGCLLYANTRYCQHSTIMRSNGTCMSEILQNLRKETLKICKIRNKPFDQIKWTFLSYSRE